MTAPVVVMDPEGRELADQLEASIRKVRVDKARAAYVEAKARILSWAPGDVVAARDALSVALGAADTLIDALDAG
jgi:hypothetical protein